MRVVTAGVFDLFHYGHVKLLERCNAISDGKGVTVLLNTDEFVTEYKKKPAFPYKHRKKILESSTYVVQVLKNTRYGFRKQMQKLAPCILVVGTDWVKKDYYKQMEMTPEDLEYLGIELVYVPYTEGISTSSIKKGIENGDL